MAGPRAVVVNADIGVCQLVGALLEDRGACVHAACEAQEALELLRTHSVEVLFTDLRPPRDEVLRLAREEIPGLTAVAVAETGSLDSAIEAMRLGVCDYLTKPLTREKVFAAWRRALERQQSQGGSAAAPHGFSWSTRLSSRYFQQCPSRSMQGVREQAERLAMFDVPVLIKGEAGTGKRLLGECIHSNSSRQGPVVHLFSDGISDGSLDPGYFADADPIPCSARQSLNQLFSTVRGGTLVAREITALPRWAQIRLLDLVESQGASSSKTTASGMRLVATSTDDLDRSVAEGRLCRGLYDVLNAAVIRIPPLRERLEDIRPLAEHFCQQYETDMKQLLATTDTGSRTDNGGICPSSALMSEHWRHLSHHHWPGNVRELASVVRRLMLAPDDRQRRSLLREFSSDGSQTDGNDWISVPLNDGLKQIELYVIREVVKRHDGNKAAAARALGLHRRTMYRLLDNNAD